MELQPVLRPRVARLAAKELWEEEQGVIPPERRADIEVYSWGRRLGNRGQTVGNNTARPMRTQAGRLLFDWGVDLLLTVVIGGVLVFPW